MAGAELALAVEPVSEEVGHDALAEERHHRPLRPPAQRLGAPELVAVVRAQFDDA